MNPTASVALLLGLGALFPFVLISCIRPHPSGQDDPGDAPPFRVELQVEDGMRTLDRVLLRPRLTLTVSGGGEDALYEALLRLGNGPERTVRHIWSGVPKDLSGEILSLSDCGSVTVTGYVHDTADPSERMPFEGGVRMSYAPAEMEPFVVVTPSGREPLLDGMTLTEGTSGTMETAYSPEDTYLHIALSVKDAPAPLLIESSEASNHRGRFSIPFYAAREGACTLTVMSTSGRDTTITPYLIHIAPMQGDKTAPDHE